VKRTPFGPWRSAGEAARKILGRGGSHPLLAYQGKILVRVATFLLVDPGGEPPLEVKLAAARGELVPLYPSTSREEILALDLPRGKDRTWIRRFWPDGD